MGSGQLTELRLCARLVIRLILLSKRDIQLLYNYHQLVPSLSGRTCVVVVGSSNTTDIMVGPNQISIINSTLYANTASRRLPTVFLVHSRSLPEVGLTGKRFTRKRESLMAISLPRQDTFKGDLCSLCLLSRRLEPEEERLRMMDIDIL